MTHALALHGTLPPPGSAAGALAPGALKWLPPENSSAPPLEVPKGPAAAEMLEGAGTSRKASTSAEGGAEGEDRVLQVAGSVPYTYSAPHIVLHNPCPLP